MFVHFRHVSTRTIDIDGASGPQKAFEEKCFYRSLKIIAKYSRYTGVTMDFLTYTPWKINDSLNNHRCMYKAMTRLLTNSIVIFSRTRHSFFISGMVDIYDLAAIGQRITTAFSHATRPVDTNCVYTRSNAAHSTLKWTVCRSDVAIIVALMAIHIARRPDRLLYTYKCSHRCDISRAMVIDASLSYIRWSHSLRSCWIAAVLSLRLAREFEERKEPKKQKEEETFVYCLLSCLF